MKKKTLTGLLLFAFVLLAATPSVRAGHVIKEETRSWAKEAVEQEQELEAVATPNTIAVLNFHNKTGVPEFDLLQKGLTLMLITDLSKLKDFQVVERIKVQALAEELGLGASGLVDPATAPRMGKLLGAEHLIGGDILEERTENFQLKAGLLNVPQQEVIGRPGANGKLLDDFFRMEKDLLFDIISQLRVELTPEQEKELMELPTTNIDAMMSIFRGLEASDRGNYAEAAFFYKEAMAMDPNFTLGQILWDEIPGPGEPEPFSVEEGGEPTTFNPEEVRKDDGGLEDPIDRRLADDDGDGFSEDGGDCDDTDGNVFPGNQETCDEKDNNCDGSIDEGVTTTFYQDADGDEFGNGNQPTEACAAPGGYVTNSSDCNDSDGDVFPGNPETCDEKDNNCDGSIDEGVTTTFYQDADGDEFGNGNQPTEACAAPGGYVTNSSDCNDNDGDVFPGNPETCDEKDNNCDGSIDEGVTTTFYQDADGDEFGNGNQPTEACAAPGGYVTNSSDCNDNDGDVFPGNPETCDEKDNNCDGSIDEGVTTTFYLDSDGDEFGDAGQTTEACEAPAGYVMDSSDCDDNDGDVFPSNPEVCDGKDNDCSGEVDDGLSEDADGDGHYALGSCFQPADDCDDSDGSVYPGAFEFCDDKDNNCDGQTDEGCPSFTGANQPPLVDRDSFNTAAQNILDDEDLRVRVVEDGEFKPGSFGEPSSGQPAFLEGWDYEWTGPYLPGLQTIGANDGQNVPQLFVNLDTLASINADGFLAYAVQVEEDRLNQEVLGMHRDAAEQRQLAGLVEEIDSAVQSREIRDRDDFLMRKADAQSGRVLRDAQGDWVRVEQYILRPDDQTVQVLNVCLRGGGENKGLSTMEWTTSFNELYESDLRSLPWSQWLETRADGDFRYIQYPAQTPVTLREMFVKFTNPIQESLQEERTFLVRPAAVDFQEIDVERLILTNRSGGQETYNYSAAFTLNDGDYQVRAASAPPPGSDVSGFEYRYMKGGTETAINVAFFVLGDADRSDNQGVQALEGTEQVADIWDALRMNEGGGPYIGSNNLQIRIDEEKGSFTQPIDVVYIPMSRMLWKNKPVPEQ